MSLVEKKYDIGGKTYIQRPLLVGQLESLMERASSLTITSLDPKSVIHALGGKINYILATIMIPEGVPVKKRDIDAIEEQLDEYLDLKTATEIVTDFFVFNPASLLLGTIKEMVARVSESVEALTILKSKSEDLSKNSALET
jgi:hypothetical protein